MNQLNNRKAETGAIHELVGAVVDSFTRDRTERLIRLEERLAWFNRLVIICTVIAFGYFGYQLWGEMLAELDTHQVDARRLMRGDEASDHARSSIFLIFAAALGGPVALLAAYLVLGFFYNVANDALTKRIPLTRFLVVPALLVMGLVFLTSRREELKETLFDAYDEVELRIASAKTLREQAKAMGQQVRELHQMEAQLHALEDEPQPEDGTTLHSAQEAARTPAAERKANAVAQDEAVQRLGEMMLNLQGMSLQPPAQGSEPSTANPPSSPPTAAIPTSPGR